MGKLNIGVYTPPVAKPKVAVAKPITPFALSFKRGDKGMVVHAVSPVTGESIGKLVSFRDDGQLRVYGGLRDDLGLKLDDKGALSIVRIGGVPV